VLNSTFFFAEEFAMNKSIIGYVIAWLLGVPLSLLVILWLLGVGH
jgi:hypothetical protein